MSAEEYIKKRLDPQIIWYSKKSSINQKIYKRLQIAEIICATLIPLFSAYSNMKYMSFIIGVFGALIAVIESVSKLYKFHENWIQYRITAERLKREKYLFLSCSAQYIDVKETAENIFIQNIEDIISFENKNWNQLNTQEEPLKKS